MEKVYEFDKKEYGKRINKDDKKHNKSNLIYNSNCCFHKYHCNEKRKEILFSQKRKQILYDKDSKLYNELLGIYFHEH